MTTGLGLLAASIGTDGRIDLLNLEGLPGITRHLGWPATPRAAGPTVLAYGGATPGDGWGSDPINRVATLAVHTLTWTPHARLAFRQGPRGGRLYGTAVLIGTTPDGHLTHLPDKALQVIGALVEARRTDPQAYAAIVAYDLAHLTNWSTP